MSGQSIEAVDLDNRITVVPDKGGRQAAISSTHTFVHVIRSWGRREVNEPLFSGEVGTCNLSSILAR